MRFIPFLRTHAVVLATVILGTSAHAASDWEVSQAAPDSVRLGLYQEPGNVDVTYLELNVATQGGGNQAVSRVLSGATFSLDGGAALYAALPGEVIDNAALDAGNRLALVGPTQQAWGSLTVQGTDTFWLAAKVREGNLANGPWSSLGWAQLRFDTDGQLRLLNSHIAYNVPQLTVGAVPEPGTWALLSIGLAAVAGVTRLRRSR
jgi:hypothetical protein